MFQIWVCKDNIQQKPESPTSSGWMCHAVGSYKYAPAFNLEEYIPLVEVAGRVQC